MTNIDKSKAYCRYALNVIEGRIPACKHIINACQRFINDFQREDIYFDYKKVDRVLDFISILKHPDGPPGIAGCHIELADWQAFIVGNIFGWYYKKDNVRRFSRSYLQLARKACKTELVACMGLFSLLEYAKSSQVILTANSLDQAHRLFEFITYFCKVIDPAQKSLKRKRNVIDCVDTGGFIKCISSDYSTADGLNPWFSAVDELHQSPDSQGVDVLRSGAVQPGAHLCMLTTSGFNSDSYCHEVRDLCVDILSGKKEDDRFFAVIYELDPDDDWHNRDIWEKAQPNIGRSAPWQFYDDCFQAALNSPTDERNFLVKNLNFWLNLKDSWIPESCLDLVRKDINLEEFKDKPCYVGFDLSSVSDITAITFAWLNEKDNKIYFYNEYFLPEACLRSGPNHDFFRRMNSQGYLNIVPGNVIDYQSVVNLLWDRFKNMKFVYQKVGYDSWNSTQLIVDLINSGMPASLFLPVSMSIGSMNKATKELERLILSDMCVVDHNPITRWMFQNVCLKIDMNGNIKPNKAITSNGTDQKSAKIDGVISMIVALQMLMEYGARKIYMP